MDLFRHTSASLLIAQRTDIRTIANRLGHSNTSVTLDIYSHAFKEVDAKASDTLEILLEKKA
ncbi:MAG: tyrosine-type recombinase/integrase [Lachnospiraceae bacterium]|nr:tyrosine-type recombinase/integrase [Lachnospiraceae bacterium]